MKKSFFDSLNSIRILSIIGIAMLSISLITAKTWAEGDEAYSNGKIHHCENRESHGPRDGDLSRVLSNLDRKLDLTEDQKTAISQVIEQYNPEIKALETQMREGRNAERKLMKQDSFDEAAIKKHAEQQADLMEKMIILKAKSKNAIHSQLTGEQKAKLEEMFEVHRQKREEKDA